VAQGARLGKEFARQHLGSEEWHRVGRDIRADVPPEERLRGLTVEDLRQLPPEELERFRQLLQQLPPQGEGAGSS
jgi:hypothetical protein